LYTIPFAFADATPARCLSLMSDRSNCAKALSMVNSGKAHILFNEFNRYTPIVHFFISLTSLSMSSTLRAPPTGR
jgi:hypothetical protein